MTTDAEKRVLKFYDSIGWETLNGLTEDARRFEDLRACAVEYVSNCRLRLMQYIPSAGEYILDMASGPIQYVEYLEYSKNFKKRYCIDLSAKALEAAKAKIGDHGVFIAGSFFDVEFDDNFFDCAISLHTIYHIDKDQQEEAVRKLIRVTKRGKPVIIVYNNPDTIIQRLIIPFRPVKNLWRLIKQRGKMPHTSQPAYFFSHPLEWWARFNDLADIKIVPWRSFVTGHQKKLIPDNNIGRKMLDILFRLEDRFPDLFTRYFQYPMIILTKK